VAFDWADEDPGPWAVLDMTGTDPTELSAARWWAETKLGTLAEPDRIDTLMVVAELLDNAYRHGGGPRQLRIRYRHRPCDVTVAVIDAGTGKPRLRAPDRGGGRGLLIVDRLCAGWGVRHHDDGKLVWGRLPCTAREAQEAP
jgi:anti-sigma regulatory factor (Ser/Thr protein kinase)